MEKWWPWYLANETAVRMLEGNSILRVNSEQMIPDINSGKGDGRQNAKMYMKCWEITWGLIYSTHFVIGIIFLNWKYKKL